MAKAEVSSSVIFEIIQRCADQGVAVEPQVVSFVCERLPTVGSASLTNGAVQKICSLHPKRRETLKMQELYSTSIIAFEQALQDKEEELRKRRDVLAEKLAASEIDVEQFMMLLEDYVGEENHPFVADAVGSNADEIALIKTGAEIEEIFYICVGLRVLRTAFDCTPVIDAFTDAYNKYVSSVDAYMFSLQRLVGNVETVLAQKDRLSSAVSASLKEELYNRVQLLVYFRDCKSLADAAREELSIAHHALQNMGSKLSESSDRMLFREAGRRYRDLLDVMSMLQKAGNVTQALEVYLNQPLESLTPSIVEEAHRLAAEKPSTGRQSVLSGPIQRIQARRTEFPGTKVALNGFDPVEIVDGRGLLVAGSPDLCAQYGDQFFLLSTEENLKSFCERPTQYLDAVLMEAMVGPELVILLGLSSAIVEAALQESENVQVVAESSVPSKPTKSTKVDSCTETPVHFVESHIDHKYTFSEWELRRRALQMADLRSKRTHSVQTNKSHFRRENETQVYLPKESAVQTAKEKGIQPRKETRYIQGLRGDPSSKLKVVTLELDL